MFVRLLVLLISHVLYYFSDLVCCRSSVQFVVQRGGFEQRRNQAPGSEIERTLVQLSALRASDQRQD